MICYLIRHGKDDDTVRGGWNDASLTPEGIAQADAMALRLTNAGISRIYTSDLPRAVQTASILAEKLALPVTQLPQFRETNNGYLAGMKHETANQKYRGLYWNTLEWDEPYPGGESPHAFYDRIRAAWLKFKDSSTNMDGNIALVTHAGVINAILCTENGVTFTNRCVAFPVKNAHWVSVEI